MERKRGINLGKPNRTAKKRRRRDQRNSATESPGSDEVMISRRDFLKIAGLTAAGVASEGIRRALMSGGSDEPKPELEPTPEAEPTPEVQDLYQELRYDPSRRININPEMIDRTIAVWEDKCRNEPAEKRSLHKAFNRIKKVRFALQEEFKKRDVPQSMAYLAIPESHFKLSVDSGYARGPYQFTELTGEQFGLVKRDKRTKKIIVDNRGDPIESGKACARYLKKLHDRFKDWRITVARYNGSYVKKYRIEREKVGADVTYEGFLDYMENMANRIQNETANDKFYSYNVSKGENLHRIGLKFGVSSTDLMIDNGIADETKLSHTKNLKIPLQNDVVREKVFNYRTRNVRQNLEYIAKSKVFIDVAAKYFGDTEGFPQDHDQLADPLSQGGPEQLVAGKTRENAT